MDGIGVIDSGFVENIRILPRSSAISQERDRVPLETLKKRHWTNVEAVTDSVVRSSVGR